MSPDRLFQNDLTGATADRQVPLPPLHSALRRYDVAREQLAEAAGVSIDTVNNWCSGRSMMRLNHFAATVSLLVKFGMPRPELQRFVLDVLTEHGLSGPAGHDLLPPARIGDVESVLYVAPEVLTKSNRLSSVGARDYLRPLGVGLLMTSADSNLPLLDRSLADFVMANQPKGMIISRLINGEWAHTMIEAATSLGIPVVATFERSGLRHPVARFVGIDNDGIGYTAGKYLLSKGHIDVGFIGRVGMNNAEDARFRGMARACSEAGLKIDEANIFNKSASGEQMGLINDRPDQMSAASAAFGRITEGKISGVFCGSEHDTVAFVRSIDSLNPVALFRRRIGVVGIAMDDWADFLLGPSFAYIRIPAYQIGKEAAKLIMAQGLREADRDFAIILPTELRTRS